MSGDAKTCATCAHWSHVEVPGTVDPKGQCQAIYPVLVHEIDAAEVPLAVIGSDSVEADVADFWTAPTFGCVLHESKRA